MSWVPSLRCGGLRVLQPKDYNQGLEQRDEGRLMG